MDRRALLTRATVAVGATTGAVLAGCLGDGRSLDTDSASSGSAGDDDDDDDGDDDDEPVETHELGNLEGIDDPDRLIVRNAGEDDREIELAVSLKTESEEEDHDGDDSEQGRNECGADLERTLTLPSTGFLEVTIGESAGYTVTVESDGALTQSSVGHSGESSVSRTTVEITEGGVNTRTETVSSS